MSRTFIPHDTGRFRGVAIPRNRLDGEQLGLAVIVDDHSAFERSTLMEIKREARAAGVTVLGVVPDDERLIAVMKMPDDPARLFTGLSGKQFEVRSERYRIDLRDEGEVLARFMREASTWDRAGEGVFAPILLGRNLNGAEVTERMLGRTFVGRRTQDVHAEWEAHSDGFAKGHGARKALFLRAETVEDYEALARTLVARLDRDGEPLIREREIKAMLARAAVPAGIEVGMAEFRELIELEVARGPRSGGVRSREAAVRLSEGFPPYSERSGLKLLRAQFSTPPAVGFAAAEFLKPEGRTILEPTVGNGVFVASAVGAGGLVTGVELDPRRASRAREALGEAARVTVGDAMLPDAFPANPLDGDGRYDALVANPPYMRLSEASTADREIATRVRLPSLGVDFEAKTAETLIAAQGIERIRQGGNAVLVMPAEMMRPSDIKGHRRQFQALLNSAFERVESVVLEADLYESMGSRFPVIVHFCENKRTPDTVPDLSALKDLSPAEYPVVGSYGEFFAVVDRVIENSRITALEPADVAVRRAAWLGLSVPEEIADEQEQPEQGPRTGKDAEGEGPQAGNGDAEGRGGNRGVSPKPGAGSGAGGASGGRRREAGAAEADGPDTGMGPGDPGEAAPPAEPDGREPAETEDLSVRETYMSFWTDDFEDDVFTSPYRPASKKPGATAVVERSMEGGIYAAMHRLVADVGDVDVFVADRLGMTEEALVADSGPLSPEQIDSVALSLRNRDLKNATIIGDLMGVGKGRQLAAHIFTALREHRPVIAMTNKKHLFRDLLVRDLGAVARRPMAEMIESGDIRPFIFNRGREGRLTAQDGKTLIYMTADGEVAMAKRDGTVPPAANLVVTTYSQFQTRAGEWRADAIKAWVDHQARDGKPPVLLLDEVHEAAGEVSRTGFVIRDLLDYATARGADIVYSSATSMKSGRNMGVYKYALPETGMSMEQLLDLVECSPLEMQEILSSEMAREGRMLQRKMPSAGIERETVKLADIDMERMNEAREMSERFAAFLREMVEEAPAIKAAAKGRFQKMVSGQAHAQSGAGGLDVTTTSPATMFDNVSRYFLLAIKGQFLREMMEDAVARGEKMVLLQEITGDTLGEYVRTGALVDDDLDEQEQESEPDASAFDPDVVDGGQVVPAHPHLGHVLTRMVDKMTRCKGTDALGIAHQIELPEFTDWGEDMKARIAEAGFERWRINTFDMAAEISESMGLGFEDITKRRLTFKTGADGKVRVSKRPIPEKMATAYLFNRGGLDVLGLNNSASTGMSVQASPDEGPDLRRRYMIFMSFLKNIADHQQAEGRIDRKGQVVAPRYSIPTTGFVADDRLASLFNRGNRNLSSMTAGTRENSKTIEDVVDLLNPIGNRAVEIVLRRNPKLADMLGIEFGEDGRAPSDLGRKLLGRAFILGPDEAAAAINEVDMCYTALLDNMTRSGKNPLRLGRYDWKAEVKVVDVLQEGDEDARELARQPLKLVEIMREEPREMEKPSRVIEETRDYIHGRKTPFVRLDDRMELASATRYGWPDWSHQLYDEVTGRSSLGAAGLVFPVPMSEDAMGEIMQGLRVARDTVIATRPEKSASGPLSAEEESRAVRMVGDELETVAQRVIAWMEDKEKNPKLTGQQRSKWAYVHDMIENSLNGTKPAFARMKWTRAVRIVSERQRAVDTAQKYAGLIEPGRLVAVNARALLSEDTGVIGEALSEAGAFDLDRDLWLPALVTSARYEDDKPLLASGTRASFYIPGNRWLVSKTMTALAGNLEAAGRGEEAWIGPISNFTNMVRADGRLSAMLYDSEIEGAVKDETRGPLGKAVFGDSYRSVLEGVRDYEQAAKRIRDEVNRGEHGGELGSKRNARIIEALTQKVVESGSIQHPAPRALLERVAAAVPQGMVVKKRYGLTGNLLAAAAATMTQKNAKALGEKAVFTDKDGANINAYLIPFGDAAETIKKVKERAAAQSMLRRDLTGSPERVEAMLGLLAVIYTASQQGAGYYGRQGEIDLSADEMETLKNGVRVLFPEALSSVERDKAWDRDEARILGNMVAKMENVGKTFPVSLFTGGDVWARSMTAEGEDKKRSRNEAMPVWVSVEKNEEGRVIQTRTHLSGPTFDNALRGMDKDQLLVLIDQGFQARIVMRKTHEGLKNAASGSAVERMVEGASTKTRFMGHDMTLTKGLMAAEISLHYPANRRIVADFMMDASRAVNGLNAEFMVGGFGKNLLMVAQSAMRDHIKGVEVSLMRDNFGVTATQEVPPDLDEAPLPEIGGNQRPRSGFAPGS